MKTGKYIDDNESHCTKMKMSSSLRSSLVNVNKSTGNCGFVQIYQRHRQGNASFFVQRSFW